MTLPEKGWTGYGAPGHPCGTSVDALRRAAIASDNAGHARREWLLDKWLADTVYGAAVNRRIAEIGRRT